MKFNLVFENSGDCIEFEVVANHDLIAFFIEKANDHHQYFSDGSVVHKTISKLLQEINWSVSKSNEILYDLIGKNFAQYDDLAQYLDQKILNRQHAVWVNSQENIIEVDTLRNDANPQKSKLGYQLHEVYPDEIRKIRLAEAMEKLGYIFPYEEVNMSVHRLEMAFARQIEYKSSEKWNVFDNPYIDSIHSANDTVNFSFGYTYVGRQYYNKWQFFDSELEFDDHYNFEKLEWAFQLNLARPQTIPFSREFLDWCDLRKVKPITTQLPIANVIDLEKNLTHYRKMLYKNSREGNQATLSII